MKKFFTIAAGLVLGTFGFNAMAAVSFEAHTPTGPNAKGIISVSWGGTEPRSFPSQKDDPDGYKAAMEQYYNAVTGLTTTTEYDDGIYYPYVTDEDGNEIKIPIANIDFETSGAATYTTPGTMLVNLKGLIPYNGNYTFHLPADVIWVMYEHDQSFQGNTGDISYPFEWTLGEEKPSTTVYYPQVTANDNIINIQWTSKSKTATLSAGVTNGAQVITSSNTTINLSYVGENGDDSSPFITLDTNNNCLKINFNPTNADLPFGTYKVVIPAGFVKFDNGDSSNSQVEDSFTYAQFNYQGANFYGPTKAGGKNPYSTDPNILSIEFIGMNYASYEPFVEFITINDNVNVPADAVTVSSMSPNVLDLDLSQIEGLVNGDNTLNMPAGVVTLKTATYNKEGMNEEEDYTFKWSGVKDPTVTLNFNLSVSTMYVDVIDDSELPQAVSISYFDNKKTFKDVPVPVEGNMVTFEFPYGVNVDIAPVGKYMITEVANSAGDLTIENGGQSATDYDKIWSFSIPEVPEFKETTISVEVGLTPPSVNLSFECNDPDNTLSPQDLVTIDYGTSEKQVPTDNGFRAYISNTASTTINVAPIENYEIKSVAITDADQGSVTLADLSNYNSSYSVSNGAYTFELNAKVSGFTFLFDVEPTTKAGVDITMNFTSEEELMASAWTYVDKIYANSTSTIDVDSDEFTYTYTTPDTALDLVFVPEEDYKLVLSCERSSNNEQYGEVIEASSYGTNALQLSLPLDGDAIPEDLVITITIKSAISNVTANFSISGQGVENAGQYVNVTFGDETIDVTSGFGGESVAAGTVITISPVEGYAISEITTYTLDTATIQQPAVENGNWTVTILDEPAESFATFSVTVTKYTGINTINSVDADAVFYNLQGVKVANPVKGGIYIVNGKKVVY